MGTAEVPTSWTHTCDFCWESQKDSESKIPPEGWLTVVEGNCVSDGPHFYGRRRFERARDRLLCSTCAASYRRVVDELIAVRREGM